MDSDPGAAPFTTGVTSRLIDAALQVAMRGVAEYERAHGVKVDAAALVEPLREEMKAALPEAMKDAREALAAHMPQAAEATFAASMVLAGTRAAQRAAGQAPLARTPAATPLYALVDYGQVVDGRAHRVATCRTRAAADALADGRPGLRVVEIRRPTAADYSLVRAN